MKYLIPLLLLISSCTAQKAATKAEKLIKKYPAAVLPVFRSAYPCTTEKIDTIYNWHDTTIFVDCPPPVKTRIVDTMVVEGKISPVRVKKVISIRSINTIKEVQDSATIKTLLLRIDSFQTEVLSCKKLCDGANKDAQKYKGRSRSFLEAFLIMLIALLISLFANYIQSKK